MRYLAITLFLIGSLVSAQELPSIRELMNLEEIHAVLDFGFNKKVPKSVVKRDFEKQGKKNGALQYKELRYDKLEFNSDHNLVQRNIHYTLFGKPAQFLKTYSYSSPEVLTQVLSKDKSGTDPDEKTTFEYYSDNQLKKTVLTNKFGKIEKLYSTLEQGVVNMHQPDIQLHLRFSFISGKLKKEVQVTNGVEDDNVVYYYNNQGKLWYSETAIYRTMYELNNNGNISKISVINLNRKDDVSTTEFQYSYDKYGNWVACASLVNLTNSYGLKSFPNISLREITYPNGEVTGYSDPVHADTNSIVSGLIDQLNEKNNSTVYKYAWKKNDDGSSYWFYENGKAITERCKSYFALNDLFVFDPVTRGVFCLKDFKTETANRYHRGEKVTEVGRTSGVWLKNKDQTFRVFDTKGLLFKITDKGWVNDKKDFVVYGDRAKGEQYILKDYKNAPINKLLEAKMYHGILKSPKSNPVTKNNIGSSASQISKTSYKFSEEELSTLNDCGQDTKCMAKLFDNKYLEMRKVYSGNGLAINFADYALALNNEKPGHLFSIFMKSSYVVDSGIFDVLPKSEMDKIRKQAADLKKNYNKYINSDEVKKEVEKKGGTIRN